MDVLQEIFRSNGRSVNLLQHKKITVGMERGMYYVRAEHENAPREVVTVFMTADEVDQLIELRNRKVVGMQEYSGIRQALRGFALVLERKR